MASRDPKELSIGSRLVCDLLCEYLDSSIVQHATGKLLDLCCGRVPLHANCKDFGFSIFL